MRVDEPPGDPPRRVRPHLETIEGLLGPLGVVAQVGDDLVVLVHERDPRVQVGHEQHVAADVEVGREADPADHLERLAVEVERLEPRVGPVGDDQHRRAPRPVVEHQPVRGLELADLAAEAAEGVEELARFVVSLDRAGAVAVGDVEAAVRGEGDVGRHVFGLGVVVRRDPLGPPLGPHDLAGFGGLIDEVVPDVGEVQVLGPPLLADVDPVPATVILLAEGADECAVGVEDDDRVEGLFLLGSVLDVDETILVDGDPVGLPPADVPGALAPAVDGLVPVLALAEDRRPGAGPHCSGP